MREGKNLSDHFRYLIDTWINTCDLWLVWGFDNMAC